MWQAILIYKLEKLLRDTLQIEDRTCLLCRAHWVEERKGTGLLLKLMGSFPGTSPKVNITQSCLTLCDPMDCTVHGILQVRILEWLAFPFSRGSSYPRDRMQVSCIAGRFFTILTIQILYRIAGYHQGSPRILEWVAYPFSSRSSWPRNQTRVSCIAGEFFTTWATR